MKKNAGNRQIGYLSLIKSLHHQGMTAALQAALFLGSNNTLVLTGQTLARLDARSVAAPAAQRWVSRTKT